MGEAGADATGTEAMTGGAGGPPVAAPVGPNHSRLFVRWLRAFGPFAFFLLLDPFGCARQARLYSENLVLRVAAPFHCVGAGRACPSAGNKVLVVRITPETLRKINPEPDRDGKPTRPTWPISRGCQVHHILRPILDTHPRAVFLDWTFNADNLAGQPSLPNCDLEAEVKHLTVTDDARVRQRIIAMMHDHPETRLLLGSKPDLGFAGGERIKAECHVSRVSPTTLAKRSDVATDLRNWRDAPQVELVTTRAYDLVHYPLVVTALAGGEGDDCGEESKADGYLASPAYALFAAGCSDGELCRQLRQRPPSPVFCADLPAGATAGGCATFPPPPAGAPPPPSYRRYPAPTSIGSMVPLWAAFRSAWQVGVDPPPSAARNCLDPREGLWLERYSPAAALAATMFRDALLHGEAREPCGSGVDAITLEELQTAGVGPGRLVLVGLDLSDQPDGIANPLHPNAPGVLLHAVALENLLSFGDRYFKDSGRLLGHLDGSDLATLAVGLLFSLGALRSDALKRWGCRIARHGLRSRVWRTLAIASVVALLVALLLVWPALAVSATLLVVLTAFNMRASRGSFGGLFILVAAFTGLIVLPFLFALFCFFVCRWSLIDWLVLTATLAWLPETAVEVLDDAWHDETHRSDAAGRRPWLSNVVAPVTLVVAIALTIGFFVPR